MQFNLNGLSGVDDVVLVVLCSILLIAFVSIFFGLFYCKLGYRITLFILALCYLFVGIMCMQKEVQFYEFGITLMGLSVISIAVVFRDRLGF